MKRVLARVLTTLLAVPVVALTIAGPAQAGSVTIPGCYGATSYGIVCNPTVSYGVPLGVETYEETVPVCVGECFDVPLTLVRTAPGEPLLLCASWTNRSGTQTSHCVDGSVVDELVDTAEGLVYTGRHIGADVVLAAKYVVCYNDQWRCSAQLVALFNSLENLIRP